MTPLFKKLNFKGQKKIAIINAPAEFGKEMEDMKDETLMKSSIRDCRNADFVISFVKTKKQINSIAEFLQKKKWKAIR